jgi:hypothetical protein
MHTVEIKDKSNPDFENHVEVSCSCGWETDAHQHFAQAILERHLTMNEQKGNV